MMPSSFILSNIRLYESGLSLKTVPYMTVSEGKIAYMGKNPPEPSLAVIDCADKLLIKPFCDHHYHIPGSRLYDLFGVNLGKYAPSEYRNVLLSDADGLSLVRGFGWEVASLADYFAKVEETPLSFLDGLFPTRAVFLFSMDFHSCWCNSVALAMIEEEGIRCEFQDSEIPGGKACILHEKIAEEIFHSERVRFSDDEIEEAILAEQRTLLSRGITELFSLLFIGAPFFKTLDVLKHLEDAGKLKLKIRFAYTTHPNEARTALQDNIEKCFTYESEHLAFAAVKVYMDGVIDNHSALLLSDYADKKTCSEGIWQENELLRVARCALQYELPLHVHAIGDGAVKRTAKALSSLRTPKKGRHIIAHIQLCDEETMALMAEHHILGCLQPFWFYRGDAALPVDKERLGERVERQYPAASLLKHGVKLLFSSDCPATYYYDPIFGIRLASQCGDKEEITLKDAYNAYYAGSYFDEGITLSVNDAATFLLLDKPLEDEDTPHVKAVYLDGALVWEA